MGFCSIFFRDHQKKFEGILFIEIFFLGTSHTPLITSTEPRGWNVTDEKGRSARVNNIYLSIFLIWCFFFNKRQVNFSDFLFFCSTMSLSLTIKHFLAQRLMRRWEWSCKLFCCLCGVPVAGRGKSVKIFHLKKYFRISMVHFFLFCSNFSPKMILPCLSKIF